MTLLPTQCVITAEPSYNRYLCEKSTIIDAGNRNHNKSLAMSQLGTVYATKRRRRNGKRWVIFNQNFYDWKRKWWFICSIDYNHHNIMPLRFWIANQQLKENLCSHKSDENIDILCSTNEFAKKNLKLCLKTPNKKESDQNADTHGIPIYNIIIGICVHDKLHIGVGVLEAMQN